MTWGQYAWRVEQCTLENNGKIVYYGEVWDINTGQVVCCTAVCRDLDVVEIEASDYARQLNERSLNDFIQRQDWPEV